PNLPDVAWENVTYTPQQGRPYFATQTQGRNQTALGVGAETAIQHDLTYTIRINYPVDEGMQPVLNVAAALANYFKRGTSIPVTSGGKVIVTLTRTPPAIQDDNWIMIPLQVICFHHQM